MNTDKQPADFQGEADENMSEEQILEAMFSNLVIQQTRTALFTLGQIPDPNSGQRVLDHRAEEPGVDQTGRALSQKQQGRRRVGVLRPSRSVVRFIRQSDLQP